MLTILASDNGGMCSERNFLGDGGWRGRARPISESLLPERRPHYRRDRRSDRHESRGALHGVLPMTTGSVKFWNEDRGYGFLTTDDGDLFMHVSHWVEEDDPQPGVYRSDGDSADGPLARDFLTLVERARANRRRPRSSARSTFRHHPRQE
jgi:'Cold-shock' DNA-binding domain